MFIASTSAVLVIIHAESPVLSTAPLAWSPADSFTAIGCSTDAQQLFTGVAISAAVVMTAPAADDDCTADDDPSADAARTATRERCRAGTPSTVAGFPAHPSTPPRCFARALFMRSTMIAIVDDDHVDCKLSTHSLSLSLSLSLSTTYTLLSLFYTASTYHSFSFVYIYICVWDNKQFTDQQKVPLKRLGLSASQIVLLSLELSLFCSF